MPDVEIAPPGIDGQDQTHVPTLKGNPLVLCRIIQTFMMETIQEFYHIFPVQRTMIDYNTILDALRIGVNMDELDGNKR